MMNSQTGLSVIGRAVYEGGTGLLIGSARFHVELNRYGVQLVLGRFQVALWWWGENETGEEWHGRREDMR
jgi:hypothetical protein